MESDIVEVIVLFRRSDTTKAIELLQEQHGRFLYATAYGVCHNEEDCKDIIQNVLIKLAGLPITRFPTTGESSWLYTLIRNEAIDYIKYHKNHADLTAVSRVAVNDCNMEELFDLDTYETMIASLNEKQKEVVTMKVLGEMSHKEIARILGKPTGTIQWIYNTSIGKLRVQLTALASLALAVLAGIVYGTVRRTQQYSQNSSTSDSGSYEATTDTAVESTTQEETMVEDRVEEESSEGTVPQDDEEESSEEMVPQDDEEESSEEMVPQDNLEEESSEDLLPQDDLEEESSEDLLPQDDLEEEEVTTEGTVEELPTGDTIHSFQGVESVVLVVGILFAAVVTWLAILLHISRKK